MAAGQEQEQDRTEPATPFKLKEARKRGQVAKSLEINSLIVVFTALAVAYFAADAVVTASLRLGQKLLTDAHTIGLQGDRSVQLFEYVFDSTLSIFWPFVGAVMLAGILANLFQTGPILSFHPIKPDLNRLNPVSGFKRLFSKKMLFESVKTIIKMALYGAVVYFAIVSLIPKLMGLITTGPQVYSAVLIDYGRGLVAKLLIMVLLVALIDLVYTRWDYGQQLRMSRRELKEEVKRREGDPQIRSRRRQLQKEAVKRASALQRVPDADVLITNPTHLAIALKYDKNTMPFPQLTAKGAGDLAKRMREIARRSGVPVVENKPLARELFLKTAIDDGVPERLFPVVARILAWVYLQRKQRLETAY